MRTLSLALRLALALAASAAALAHAADVAPAPGPVVNAPLPLPAASANVVRPPVVTPAPAPVQPVLAPYSATQAAPVAPAAAPAAPVTPPPAAAPRVTVPTGAAPALAASAAASATASATGPAPAALAASATPAAASAPLPSPTALDTQVQDFKADVIQLNRDLLALEEELLFPANTQVAVFVSMDVGLMFDLDSVQLKIDDQLVGSYLYTPLEVAALQRGGMQRLWIGNLRTGPHTLTAFFTGKGPHDRDYKRATTLQIDKGSDPRYVELRVSDLMRKLQPEFVAKTWP